MKKRWVFAFVMVLLLMLTGCADEDALSPATSTTSTTTATSTTSTTTTITTTSATAADYTPFRGAYTDTTTIEGPCYTVDITRVDNATKEIEFALCYVGFNTSPIYTTETIRTTIGEDHTASFAWEDSWDNQGTGILVLDPEDTSKVQLLMTVTKEAEVNRATLSTRGEYKTLLRR